MDYRLWQSYSLQHRVSLVIYALNSGKLMNANLTAKCIWE